MDGGRVLRDNIASLKRDAISRIAKTAGVPYLGGLCFEEVRHIAKYWLDDFVREMIVVVSFAKRKTLMAGDVQYILNKKQKTYRAGEEDKLKKCPLYVPKSTKQKRAKGELAIEETKFYMEQYDCVHFSKDGVSMLIREIAQDYKTNLRISAEAIGLIHIALETFLVKIFQNAVLVTVHAGRKTLQPKDLNVVRRILETAT